MAYIDKENYNCNQSRLPKIIRHKRSEKGKLWAWIAKANKKTRFWKSNNFNIKGMKATDFDRDESELETET